MDTHQVRWLRWELLYNLWVDWEVIRSHSNQWDRDALMIPYKSVLLWTQNDCRISGLNWDQHSGRSPIDTPSSHCLGPTVVPLPFVTVRSSSPGLQWLSIHSHWYERSIGNTDWSQILYSDGDQSEMGWCLRTVGWKIRGWKIKRLEKKTKTRGDRNRKTETSQDRGRGPEQVRGRLGQTNVSREGDMSWWIMVYCTSFDTCIYRVPIEEYL